MRAEVHDAVEVVDAVGGHESPLIAGDDEGGPVLIEADDALMVVAGAPAALVFV